MSCLSILSALNTDSLGEFCRSHPHLLCTSLYVSLTTYLPLLIDLPPIPGLINFRAASINSYYYPFLSQIFLPLFFFLPAPGCVP
jgi:hypothetical protein